METHPPKPGVTNTSGDTPLSNTLCGMLNTIQLQYNTKCIVFVFGQS